MGRQAAGSPGAHMILPSASMSARAAIRNQSHRLEPVAQRIGLSQQERRVQSLQEGRREEASALLSSTSGHPGAARTQMPRGWLPRVRAWPGAGFSPGWLTLDLNCKEGYLLEAFRNLPVLHLRPTALHPHCSHCLTLKHDLPSLLIFKDLLRRCFSQEPSRALLCTAWAPCKPCSE